MRQRPKKKSTAEDDDDGIVQIREEEKKQVSKHNRSSSIFSDAVIGFHLFCEIALLKIVLSELKQKPALGHASVTGIEPDSNLDHSITRNTIYVQCVKMPLKSNGNWKYVETAPSIHLII